MTIAPAVDELDGIDPDVYRRRWYTLATMCLCLALVAATVSSVNVAVPAMAASELRPTAAQLLWIVDAYTLVFAVLLLPFGALGDRFGRRGALQIGLSILIMASLVSSRVHDADLLLVCRAVMGAGAAMVMPSTLSLLQVAFPRRERAKAISIWVGFAGAGGVLGPILSGAMLAHFWWGSVFFVTVPIAAVALALSVPFAPRSREPLPPRLDPAGSVLSVLGFTGLLVGIIEGPEQGWSDPVVIGAFMVSIIAFVAFVAVELHVSEPLLDMRFFRDRRFATGAVGVTVQFFSYFSLVFLLTQYLQFTRGYTAIGAAVIGIPFAVTMLAISPRAPAIAARIGTRRAVAGGMTIVVISVLLFSRVTTETSIWYVVGCFMLSGVGVSNGMAGLSSAIVQSVPAHKVGVGSAVNDTTREVGAAMGVGVVGSIVNSIYRSHARPAIDRLASVPEVSGAAVEEASRNVGAALRSVREAIAAGGDPVALGEIADSLRTAWVDGYRVGMATAGIVTLLGAIYVYARMPEGGSFGGGPED